MLRIFTKRDLVIRKDAIGKAVSNRTGKLRSNLARLIRVNAVRTLELNQVVAIAVSFRDDALSDPIRILRDLLVDPSLQLQLIIDIPAGATQVMVLVLRTLVLLNVLLNLKHSLIGKVRRNNLKTLDTAIILIADDLLLTKTAKALVQVPVRLTVEGTALFTVGSLLSVIHLAPLGLVAKHLLCISTLDENLVRTSQGALSRTGAPAGTTSSVRNSAIRHLTLTVATDHLVFVTVIAVDPDLHLLATTASSDVVLRVKLTVLTIRIDIRTHVNCVRTVFIHSRLVHRRSNRWIVTSLALGRLLKPLRVHSRALKVLPHTGAGRRQRLTKATLCSGITIRRSRELVVEQDRTRNSLLTIDYTRRVNRIRIRFTRGSCSLRLRRISTRNNSRSILRKRNRLRQRRNQRKRQRSRSNRRATTTCNVILLHRKIPSSKMIIRLDEPFPVWRRQTHATQSRHSQE